MTDRVIIGPLEFLHEGTEMFVNKLADPDDPDGDGDHVATADGIWDDVWEAFVAAASQARRG